MKEASASIVEQYDQPLLGHKEEILVGVIVEVEEESLGCSIQEIHPGFPAGVAEGSVLSTAVEEVGQARSGENVEVLEPISICITYCQAVVSVDTDTYSRIQAASEVVGDAGLPHARAVCVSA